jgi:5-guanidino-2-oxopentanoate decarboxylase
MSHPQRPLGAQMSHALKARGVDVIFGIPGVHNIELYRGIEEAGITHVLTRHEQGAGFMADGYARATGKPGVAYVITGPGLCNIMTPMGQAYSDSVPMLVISSCLEREHRSLAHGRLHEMLDQEAAAATVCEWSVTAPDARGAFQLIDQAFMEFKSKRPRPKHIQVPIDVLGALSDPAPSILA